MREKIVSILVIAIFLFSDIIYVAAGYGLETLCLRVPLAASKRVEEAINKTGKTRRIAIKGNFIAGADLIEEALARKAKINTLIVESKDSAELEAARQIADLIASKNRKGEKIVIGFATGGTYEGIYKKLIEITRKENISWQNVITFNLDEYVWKAYGYNSAYRAQYYESGSYRAFMRNNLFTWLKENAGLQEGSAHFMNGLTDDPEKEAQDYENLIMRETNGHGADLQVLGIGGKGHVAFIEARSNMSLDDFLGFKTKVEELTANTREANSRFFDNNVDAVPAYAMTQGISTILKAKKILLVATGPAKADAIAKTIVGKATPEFPASVLQLHSDADIIMDREAAQGLIELAMQDLGHGVKMTRPAVDNGSRSSL